MKGIDIFSGQGNVDFNKVKATGVEIVYIKATEGVTYTDSTLKSYYDGAKAAGLKIGLYHFLRANNPIDEAKHFLDAVKDLAVDCKYAIDVEVDLGQTAQQILNNVTQFADYLKSQGKEVVVYTYTSFLKEYLNGLNLPLWIAEYGVSKPNISVPYIGFQYSETGLISGINGNVDMDEFSENILLGSSSTPVQPQNVVVPQAAQSGNDTIRTIQMQLNTLLKKGLATDGLEGSLTTAAIKEFQEIMGLVQDGVWGPKTAGAVGAIYARPTDSVSATHMDYPTRYIQFRVGAEIDGTFGNFTKVAVQNWQARHGLSADGVVGTATWSMLLDENV
jgi:lysozyme